MSLTKIYLRYYPPGEFRTERLHFIKRNLRFVGLALNCRTADGKEMLHHIDLLELKAKCVT